MGDGTAAGENGRIFSKPTMPHQYLDNMATAALYLASDESRSLIERVVSAQGYKVGLYANPEETSTFEDDKPRSVEDHRQAIESNFRPLADGLPGSIFSEQLV